MTPSFHRLVALLALAALASCSAFDPQYGAALDACRDVDSNPDVSVSFARDIRPIMNHLKDDPEVSGCASCHYVTAHAGTDESGLDLTTLGALRRGGKTSGANIVVPGQPCKSVLVQKLAGVYPVGVRMPKDSARKLTPEEIRIVKDWIVEGARGEDGE